MFTATDWIRDKNGLMVLTPFPIKWAGKAAKQVYHKLRQKDTGNEATSRTFLQRKGSVLVQPLSLTSFDSSPSRGASGETVHFAGTAKASPTRSNGDDRRLRHIGNAPVHWHEETFSSGGILLSDENATVFLTSSDLQPVAPTQTATLNAICFFFDRIKIFQASIPRAERISYTVLFHALPV